MKEMPLFFGKKKKKKKKLTSFVSRKFADLLFLDKKPCIYRMRKKHYQNSPWVF